MYHRCECSPSRFNTHSACVGMVHWMSLRWVRHVQSLNTSTYSRCTQVYSTYTHTVDSHVSLESSNVLWMCTCPERVYTYRKCVYVVDECIVNIYVYNWWSFTLWVHGRSMHKMGVPCLSRNVCMVDMCVLNELCMDRWCVHSEHSTVGTDACSRMPVLYSAGSLWAEKTRWEVGPISIVPETWEQLTVCRKGKEIQYMERSCNF